jgi:protein PhnA
MAQEIEYNVTRGKKSMSKFPVCPQCSSEFTYEDRDLFVCPECGHEWASSSSGTEQETAVKDAHGNVLNNGDSVTIIKN